MADLILGPLVDVTISKVISVTTEQLNLAVGFKQELKKFRVVLRMLRGVLQDAEQKEVTGHFDLQDWLKELGNIVDEADNVVDEIAYEHLRYKVAQKQMWKMVSYFFTLSNPLVFRLKIANRIKNLNSDLADLNVWATGLGLQYRLANKLPQHIEIQQTDSLVGDPSKIVGRENKAQEVVKSLIDSSNNQPVCVVSIVGMGGIGKTTMAKVVCNKGQIQRHFLKIMWVCVSENFDVKQILVEMLKTIINKDDNSVALMSQDRVVKELREKLEEEARKAKLEEEARKEKLEEEARKEKLEGKAKKEEREGKNYLLILDDVWNEDRQKWENLRTCLSAIGEGVKGRLLVTTRSQNVATIMGTPPEHIHHLENLTDEDCWSIIQQRVLVSSSFPSELEGIGRAIASKCRGVALAANVIGGVLCNNTSKDVWLAIKDNSEVSIEEANGVLRVLQLSFNRLPTPALKQCFAFCSIFPKDFVMEKEMLIQLWMAEGFLQPFSESYSEMEDIGDKYFNALSSYSLFQDAERDSYGSIIACKMHDLVHDLAKFVSKSQTLILEDGSGRNILADIRHLNVIFDKGMATTKLGEATEKLHTLFSQVDVFHSMSMNLKKVRALNFYGANIDELPASLGKMKHLRFLDVSSTRIRELPKFITKLYHLQTFRFMDCWKINRPLEGIWDLVNLRHIYFNQWLLMPAGMGRLTCLKTLQLFAVGLQKGHQIKELGCLSQLRGKLEIRNLDMIRDKKEAMGAGLSEKATIQELQLVFGEAFSGSEGRCKHDEDILEGLQPHSNLKGLTVEYYCGKSCPVWMSKIENSMSERENLKNLVFMSLYKCFWLETIPSLSLSNEAKVEIKYCKNLKSIAYSSLQKLIVNQCEKLVRVGVGSIAMKSLKEVHIKNCGKLENLPMISKLQSLKILELCWCQKLRMIGYDARFASNCLQELNIEGCDRLMSMPSVDGLSSLQKIDIRSCRELESIGKSLSTVTYLKELTICYCYGLTSLPSLHGLSSLQKIDIRGCRELKSIGESLSTATCLKELIIVGCDGLTSLSNLHGLSSLQTLLIRVCGGLRSLPSGLPSCTALEELEIHHCDNLISIPDDLRRSWSIPNPACLARLKELTIGGFSTELKEFPDLGFIGSHLEEFTLIAWGEPRERLLDQIQHLTALRSLQISNFDGLEALPNWFGNLSALQTLRIEDCKSLKHMEAIRCLSKLEKLEIDGCPELNERCASGSGSEWEYISHIPQINIDGERIQREEDSIEIPSQLHQGDDNEQLPVRATGLRRFICCRN